MRILICEDQDAIRHTIQAIAQASGHEVVSVATGTQAVELALHESFDILLIDLMLSGTLDCLDTIRRLRMNTSEEDLPIMVLNVDDAGARNRARAAGATAFFSKPLRPMEMLEEINRVAHTRLDAAP